ncbi:MAG: hypothetical protein JWO91_3876 [Acidobacteriaceae bacterium]|nr:hypothetical protein [Acidobacteriaceae bacterium]
MDVRHVLQRKSEGARVASFPNTGRSNETISGALAVDLGSGPGFQTIALAHLGFSPVLAIGTSSELLDELRCHVGSLPIQIKKNPADQQLTVVPAESRSLSSGAVQKTRAAPKKRSQPVWASDLVRAGNHTKMLIPPIDYALLFTRYRENALVSRNE